MTGRSARSCDAELVAAALTGRKDAFAELVARHWATAVALGARVLGSADRGQDAAQEASITAMLSLGRLRAPDRFSAWFCGITLNVARSWLRQLRDELPATAVDGADAGPGPAERAEAAELAAVIRAAIAGLAPGQRDAVFLFYLQGLTHREVAAELAISTGAVKARLHQARAALRPRLTPLLDTEEENAMTQATTSPEWADVSAEIRCTDPGDPERVHVMVLAERDGQRRLPIWVGPAEATALAISLQSAEMPRPMAYQMAASLVSAAGARVTEVRISRLAESIFYASVVIDGPGGPHEIDARPSDAVNLAVVTGAPIRVDARLFGVETPADRPDWKDLPATAADLAREAHERMEQIRRADREAAARQATGQAEGQGQP